MDLDKVESAASKAFGKMDKAMNVDIDLETYSKIDEQAFGALAEQYGSEEVTKYIQEMEYRRLNHGKNKN